jgi:hypothetical protein
MMALRPVPALPAARRAAHGTIGRSHGARPAAALTSDQLSRSSVESLHSKLRGTILLYDELVPINGRDSLALDVW